jgi:hypothetical protein
MAKRFQVLFLILGTSLLFSITTFAYDSVVDRISKSFNVQGRSKLVVQMMTDEQQYKRTQQMKCG